MRTTVGWILITLLLVAVPAAAQQGDFTTEGWKVPSLEELADLPILGWVVQLVTDDEGASEALESTSPTPPKSETSQLDGGVDTESRGIWDPDG